jgi:hypothetical protein
LARQSTAGLPAVAASKAKRTNRVGGSNSVVESQPSKLLVAGSIPVSRSILRSLRELRLLTVAKRYGLGPTCRPKPEGRRPM